MEHNFDNSERMENLSYAIGYYRKAKGLSQEQLAEMLDISRQHLASVEAPRMNRGISLSCCSTLQLSLKSSRICC